MKIKNLYTSIRSAKRAIAHPHCTAVIVAAGSASRMRGIDKITEKLCGKPVLYHTVKTFSECCMIDEIVIVCRKDRIDDIQSICKGIKKVRLLIPGGETRTHSVYAGVMAASEKSELIAVHDGARPLVSNEIICRTAEKAAHFGAAAPAIPVKDTIKQAKDGVIERTMERSSLYAVQTPQIFDADLLKGALTNALQKKLPITDDCSAVEAIGGQVHLVKGSEENIKITTPFDLKLAKLILEGRDLF